ncbi:hypothetical protein NQZ68_023320 [Dissostichus eleginoides]|nr:hypothetical protein NQZ68_023320 [Dissostichus eleginoides]
MEPSLRGRDTEELRDSSVCVTDACAVSKVSLFYLPRSPAQLSLVAHIITGVRTHRSIMNFILETLQVLLMSIWYNLESFVHLFVPRKRKNIEGEVVLISGAGSGIGRLMAQEFAALNTVLVLWDINQEG